MSAACSAIILRGAHEEGIRRLAGECEPQPLPKTADWQRISDINLLVLKWGDHGGVVNVLHEIGERQRVMTVLPVDSVELHPRLGEQPVER